MLRLAVIAALLMTLMPTLIHGGWLGLGRYDDGVYLGMSMSVANAAAAGDPNKARNMVTEATQPLPPRRRN